MDGNHSLDKRYEAELTHHFTKQDQFGDNWAKVLGLIYEKYCPRDMQVATRELPEFKK